MHMDNKTKISRDQETMYIYIILCTKCEEFVLIDGSMNEE